MVLRDPAVQGLLQLGDLAPQAALGQLGQVLRILAACDDRPKHSPARDAQHVAGDAGQLDVGVLQHLVDAVDHRRPVADQFGPLPGQLAEFTDRGRRDEAGGEQAVLEQLGDPLGILDVGLAAGDGLESLGVDQHDRHATFQDVEDRLPVHAGRFHGGLADALFLQPVGQGQQLGGHGGEGANLGADGPVGADAADAGDDGLLVHVQAGATVVHEVHGEHSDGVPSRWGDLVRGAASSSCSPASGGRQGGVRLGVEPRSGPSSFAGFPHQTQERPHTRGWTVPRITHADSIFMGWGAPGGHDSSFGVF